MQQSHGTSQCDFLTSVTFGPVPLTIIGTYVVEVHVVKYLPKIKQTSEPLLLLLLLYRTSSFFFDTKQ